MVSSGKKETQDSWRSGRVVSSLVNRFLIPIHRETHDESHSACPVLPGLRLPVFPVACFDSIFWK